MSADEHIEEPHRRREPQQSVFAETVAALLSSGNTIRFRAGGHSMHPTIKDGESLTVAPVRASEVRVGDNLLYKTGDKITVHRVTKVVRRRGRPATFVLRGDGSTTSDEPVADSQVLGKVVAVERGGTARGPSARSRRLVQTARRVAARAKRSVLSGISLFWVLGIVAAVVPLASRAPVHAAFNLTTGSYTGNGVDDRSITGVGFIPDVVIVKGDTTQVGVLRSSTMSGDLTKPLVGGLAPAANLVQSLESGGFTIGTDARVNSNTVAYHWTAFKASAGDLKVGTYVGDGLDNHAITGVGFQGEYIIVMGAGTTDAVHSSSTMPATNSFFFTNEPGAINRVKSFGADGFTLGTSSRVNSNGVTYHYVIWNEAAGTMDVGSYVGNATDNTAITGVGFQPEYVIIVGLSADTRQKSASISTANASKFFRATADDTDAIKTLDSDGFTIGTDSGVNTNLKTYHHMSFARSVATAARLGSFTAAGASGRVLLQWQTGYEFDTLGFHVYREEANGARVRLTMALIPGSALSEQPALASGRWYSWESFQGDGTGPRPSAGPPPRYWLEAIDMSGQSAWHGPIAAGDMTFRRTPSSLPAPVGGGTGVGRKPPVTPPGAVETQQAIAANPALKVRIDRQGWYRVSRDQMAAAGFDPGYDPGLLRLYVEGQEQPMAVLGGEDGRFDPWDSIEFYGVPPPANTSGARTYWVVTGDLPGKRIEGSGTLPTRWLPDLWPDLVFELGGGVAPWPQPAPTAAASPSNRWVTERPFLAVDEESSRWMPTASAFPMTVEVRERLRYLAAVQNGEADNFFGALVGPQPVEQTLFLSSIDPTSSGEALLQVELQGVTRQGHKVLVLLNGAQVGEIAFHGQERGQATIRLSHSLVREGDNRVVLKNAGEEKDISAVRAIGLTYWRMFVAARDSLDFAARGGQRVALGGFTRPDIRVVDVTDQQNPRELEPSLTLTGGSFFADVPVFGPGVRRLLAFPDGLAQQPFALVANVPSAWHQPSPGADIVFIAHADFKGHLLPLKALREREGWRTLLVDVEDLYDEFSFGKKDPRAIKDFLESATKSWERSPRFVLLVGDASFDSDNALGLGDFDFVPTRLIPTQYLETASDDWFVDFDDDGIAEMAVGRLPVRRASELDSVISKIVRYAELAPSGDWGRKALLISDTNDVYDFTAASGRVKGALPNGIAATDLALRRDDPGPSRTALLDELNQGQLLVNYFGHGTVEAWASGSLFTSRDALALTNGDRLPIVAAWNCLNGFFHDLYTQSLAEALLMAPAGGAVAVLASSGLTAPAGQFVMAQALPGYVLDDGLTLGDAVVRAKNGVADQDVRKTWILFGDPAMRMRQP